MSDETHWPNVISIQRITGSVGLLFCDVAGWMFWALYALCGISDMVDGWLAKKLHAETEADFDWAVQIASKKKKIDCSCGVPDHRRGALRADYAYRPICDNNFYVKVTEPARVIQKHLKSMTDKGYIARREKDGQWDVFIIPSV